MSQDPSTRRAADPLVPSGELENTLDLFSRAAQEALAAAPPSFSPGQLAAGRFRILRFIAKGGMGEVYEAEDQVLHERVALKTIRPDMSYDRGILRRFIRETSLARKVTHPNACRVFDVFSHTSQGAEDLLFLSMELLEGESLAERIRREGPMPPELLQSLFHQMAGALAAAHQSGIVHRDFKPQNVMLVPSSSFPFGIRAVVTDFGLAHGYAGESAQGTLTATASNLFAGTPAYMAPEQVEGREATPRSDIYALGLVLYEMAVGKPAFSGNNPLSVATARLTSPPPDPTRINPSIDPLFCSNLQKCLERDPAQRWASVEDLLEAWSSPTIRLAGISRPIRTHPWLKWALAGSLLVTALPAVYWLRPRQPMRPSVAVLGILDRRGDMPWLSPAFGELLTSELAASGEIRVVPGDQVAQVRRDLRLTHLDALSTDKLKALAQNLGVDFIILGTFLSRDLGEKRLIGLSLQFKDLRSGELAGAFSEERTEDELFELVRLAGERFRIKLQLKPNREGDFRSVMAVLPKNPKAARAYSLGLDCLRNEDFLQARHHFENALAEEPTFALAHLGMARALSELGFDKDARSAGKKAFELGTRRRSGLSETTRILLEAQHYELESQWAMAEGKYRPLADRFPDDLDFGLRLLNVLQRAGRAQEALDRIRVLQKLPAPLGGDPRIEAMKMNIFRNLGDFQRQKESAEKVRDQAAARGARFREAQGRLMLGDAFLRLGKNAEAQRELEQSLILFRELRIPGGAAQALMDLAWIAQSAEAKEKAERMYLESMELSKGAGHVKGLARAEGNMAGLRVLQGQLKEAVSLYQSAIGTYRQLDLKSELAISLNNLASVEMEMGDLNGADPHLLEALSLARQIQDKGTLSLVLNSLGALYWNLGNLAEAQRSLEEAIHIGRETQEIENLAFALNALSRVTLLKGEIDKARTLQEESLRLEKEVSPAQATVQRELFAGEMAFRKGNPLASEQAFRRASAALQPGLDRKSELDARLGLARALLLQQKNTEAMSVLAFIGQPQDLRDSNQRFLAEILMAWGGGKTELNHMESLSRKIRETGFLPLYLEAEFLRAHALKTAGRQREAQNAWLALREEAERKGLPGVIQGSW